MFNYIVNILKINNKKRINFSHVPLRFNLTKTNDITAGPTQMKKYLA